MYISVHEHCRDWNQSNIATIASVMKLARKYNFEAIADMPNTTPKIDTFELARKRVKTARDEGVNNGYYFHTGIESNAEKIKEAVRSVREIPECIGIKMYACSSTNDRGVPTEEEQFFVYRELENNDYNGVLTVHCEKESYFKNDMWDPIKSYTWNDFRPEAAEAASVNDQMYFSWQSGAKYSLHIAHVSSPITLKLIGMIKGKYPDVKITVGITPHHLLFDFNIMKKNNGSVYKVNPPLRSEESVKELRSLMRNFSDMAIIETDHAPHNKLHKHGIDCIAVPSGIQSLNLYPLLIKKMFEWGTDEKMIHQMTYENPKKIFPKILT